MPHNVGLDFIPEAGVIFDFLTISADGKEATQSFDLGEGLLQLVNHALALLLGSMPVKAYLDSGSKVARFVWLEDIPIGLSELGALQNWAFAIAGHVHNWDIQRANLLGRFDAIDLPGKLDVHQYQVRSEPLGQEDRLVRARRGSRNLVAEALEPAFQV